MWGRIRQTLQALTAWFRPVEDELAAQYLDVAEFALFMMMPRSERQHHLRVLKVLLRRGHRQLPLLKAALLHDVGKTQVRFSIPERILAVVVKKLCPRCFERWSQGEPRGWRKAFVTSAQHPVWGAELVADIGCDAEVVWLIEHHQDKLAGLPSTEYEQWLVQLQAADDVS